MSAVIKLRGSETACNTTVQTYNGEKLIRIYNNTAGPALVTLRNAANNTVGTMTVIANTEYFFAKASTDTLASNVSILATPIAFGTGG